MGREVAVPFGHAGGCRHGLAVQIARGMCFLALALQPGSSAGRAWPKLGEGHETDLLDSCPCNHKLLGSVAARQCWQGGFQLLAMLEWLTVLCLGS